MYSWPRGVWGQVLNLRLCGLATWPCGGTRSGSLDAEIIKKKQTEKMWVMGRNGDAKADSPKASSTGDGPTRLSALGFCCCSLGFFCLLVFHYYWKKASCRNSFLGFLGRSSKINKAKLPQPPVKNIYAVSVSWPEQIPPPLAQGLYIAASDVVCNF